MRVKLFVTTLVLVFLFQSTVYARCGGYGKGVSTRASFNVCNVESCDISGLHRHNGGAYCYGHYSNDGHDYCKSASTGHCGK